MIKSELVSVGNRIRWLRKKRGLTLKQLGEMASVSMSYLSQIENGHANTNLATLQKISSSLQVPLIELFSDENTFQVSLVRRGDRRVYKLGGGGTEQMLYSQTRTFLQVAVIELPPRYAMPHSDTHAGEEFTYVVTGKLKMWLDESLSYDLEAGDIIYYRSVLPHRWENPGDEPLQVLVVNTPATF